MHKDLTMRKGLFVKQLTFQTTKLHNFYIEKIARSNNVSKNIVMNALIDSALSSMTDKEISKSIDRIVNMLNRNSNIGDVMNE